ncbi:hypothetical protein HUJ05_002712 [Dendroctonus ponderosae]|nr:hypothetical protein HUJ05_002712 [Dendroctonus ponderosae]
MYCKNIERPLKASNISLPPLRMPATRVYDITRQPIVTRFFMTLQAFATPSRSEMFYSIISTYIHRKESFQQSRNSELRASRSKFKAQLTISDPQNFSSEREA